MSNLNYTKLDEKIDKYLGTTNFRPGPEKRVINKKILEGNTKQKEKKAKINFCANTHKITRDIKWDELVGVKKSDSGLDGVFFLEFLNNKLLVLKGCSDLPTIYFGSLFFKSLKIDTPDCRIIEFQDIEFMNMMLNLERVTISDPLIYYKINYDIKDRPFLLIFEYVPSLVLFDFGISRAQQIFKKENFKSREIFISLGRILGVDILLNNSDRVPFLWSNPGNPNNILFRVNMELLPPNSNFKDPQFLDLLIENSVAIDNKPICLDPQDKQHLKKLGEYLNTLTETLKEFFYEMKNIIIFGKNKESFEFKCFNKLIDFFKNSCGNLLSSSNIFHISLGIIIMFNDITEIDISKIDNLIQFVQNKAIFLDWADIFKSNAKLLNLDYFKYIINYLKILKEENEEIFNWVKDVTGDFYSTNFNDEVAKVIKVQQTLVFKLENKIVEKIDIPVSNESPPSEEKIDDFNNNKSDFKKFGNDVHNGIYDVFDIDPSWVMEVKKREYNNLNIQKEVEIPDIKIKEPKKVQKVKIIEELDPHKTYTMEELKEKIQKDELKQTLFMKKKLNPEEFKYMEEKIKGVDETFLNEEE